MIYRKKDAKKFNIPGGTSGIIYPSRPDDKQSFALVNADGIYPEEGYSINDICTETLFVIEGEIEVELDGVWNKLKKGDIISIEPNIKYRIKGQGKVVDIITPVWDSKQNHIVNN